MPLRIGVNALYLIPGGVGGTEIYLRNLLRALADVDSENEYFVFTNAETDRGLVPDGANFTWCPQPVSAVNRIHRILHEQFRLPTELKRYRIDRLFNAGFTAPLRSVCPSITVFHDLQHKRHPEHFRWFDLPAWQFFLWASAKRSAMLVAVSDATRDDLFRFYHLPPEKIRVARHGVETEFFEIGKRRGRTEPYLLCVSTLHPHKNLDRLVRVFARFKEECPEYRLVLTGMRGFHSQAIEQTIEDLQLKDSVEITGWISRIELYRLYEKAHAFIYPSTFEGFGMPVLEAMASAVPLACSNIEPIRSIVQDTALMFDPADEEGMLNAMRLITCDETLRAALVEKALRRATDFTWHHAAEETLRAIVEAR
jgi:glycosyltransferase involved in cell wall biosynthesis